MVDYEQQFKDRELGVSARQTALATTFKIVYGWMSVGLVLSAVVAWYTAASGLRQTVPAGPGFYSCIIAGEMEVKAWTYHKGWKAPQCAGVIHTDFESL